MNNINNELYQKYSRLNDMLNNIIQGACVPNGIVSNISSDQSFDEISKILISKLLVIEACFDDSLSIQKKYDPHTIKEKIGIKKRNLADLKSENNMLIAKIKKQEQMNQCTTNESQKYIFELRNQLCIAKEQIKVLESKRDSENDNLVQISFRKQEQNEESTYHNKMEEQMQEKIRLTQRKTELENILAEKQKELEMLHKDGYQRK